MSAQVMGSAQKVMNHMLARTSIAATLLRRMKMAFAPSSLLKPRSILLKRTLRGARRRSEAAWKRESQLHKVRVVHSPAYVFYEVHHPRRGLPERVRRVLEQGGGELEVVEGQGLELSLAGALRRQRLLQRLHLHPRRRHNIRLRLGFQRKRCPQGHLRRDLATQNNRSGPRREARGVHTAEKQRSSRARPSTRRERETQEAHTPAL